MKIFVAGATGVLGIPAVARLLDAGHAVTAIARTEAKAAALRSLGASPASVDLFEPAALQAAVQGHDAVVNLATSIPPMRSARKASSWEVNNQIRVVGSANLVDAALSAGASVFVQESIAFLYADGGSTWLHEDAALAQTVWTDAVRAAQRSAERFASAGGRGVVLRFGGFYGERSVHTQLLLRAARKGLSLDIGAHDAYFPVIDVEDAASAVAAAVEEAGSGVYNVVNAQALTRREQAEVWSRVLRRPVRRLPAALSVLAGVAGPSARRSMRVSNRAFREATSWQPAYPTLEDTLMRILSRQT